MSDALANAVKLLDDKAAFEAEFPEARPYWDDSGDYLDPYKLLWRAFRAGIAHGVQPSGEVKP